MRTFPNRVWTCCMILAAWTASLSSMGQQMVPATIGSSDASPKDQATIEWYGFPGKSYRVESTKDLSKESWSAWDQEVRSGNNTLLSLLIDLNPDAQRFFRITELDTKAPIVISSFPLQYGVAVTPDSSITITLSDQSGVAPESVNLVYRDTTYTIADSRLIMDGNTVLFKLPEGQSWGEPGEQVQIELSATDKVGNSIEPPFELNFQTALPTEPAAEFVWVGNDQNNPAQPQKIGQGFQLVSQTETQLVYQYPEASHGLSIGQILISEDPINIFYRQILDIADQPERKEVTLQTQSLDFEDCYEQVSLSNAAWVEHVLSEEENNQPFKPLFQGSERVVLSGDFSGKTLATGDGFELQIEEGAWELPLDICITGNIRFKKASRLDIIASGVFTSKLRVSGRFDKDINDLTTQTLRTPYRKFYFLQQGGWVLITVELESISKMEAQGKGTFEAGYGWMSMSAGMGIGLRNGTWGKRYRSSGNLQVTDATLDAELEGTLMLHTTIRPKISIVTAGVGHLWFNLDAYLELETENTPPDHINQVPGYWMHEMNVGLMGVFGVGENVWTGSRPPPSWNLTHRRSNVLSASGEIDPIYYEAPQILIHPQSQEVEPGNPVQLFVQASGIPDPNYRWFKDDQLLSGYAGDQFNILAMDPSYGGVYKVEASNLMGAVMSQEATLSISEPEPDPTDPGETPLNIPALNMTLVPIPSGTFQMGSISTEKDDRPDEKPQTTVTISQPFWLGQTEVTQDQWLDITGSNLSHFTGDGQLPVERVTWEQAIDFCNQLNSDYAGILPAGYQFNLPTEAQWEYACRAGTETSFSYGNDPNYSQLRSYGWFAGNSNVKTHPVALKLPNAWNLYDMHGNVREWCLDWYAGNYSGNAVTDPTGPATGTERVHRGGSYVHAGKQSRSANRDKSPPQEERTVVGFRVAITPIP